MAYEIITNQVAGLTLTARLVLAGAYVGAVIALTESGTVPGHYTGSPPGGTAAGVYTVLVFQGADIIADGILRWDGAAEVLAAPAADTTTLLSRVAAAVPLASDWTPTRAAYLDAAVSSRNATAPDNAGISAIKAKTDNLPADPAAASGIPSAAAIAAAVWGAVSRTLTAGALTAADVWTYVTRTLTAGGGGPSAGDVATAVRAELATELARVDAAITSRLATAGYTAPDNAGITAIKAKTDNLPADPASQAALLAAIADIDAGALAAVVLAATAGDGTVLDAMTRINELPAGVPVQLVPVAPVDTALCRVYGYFSTPDGQPAAGVKIEFRFISPGFTRSARIVAGRAVVATTNKLGELASDAGPFLDLLRTDLLTTPGVTYQVSSAELGVKNKVITLTTETADLRALLAAA